MVPIEFAIGAGLIAAVAAYIFFGGELSPRQSRLSSRDSYIPTSGLMNLGRTCFFNAILQALASCQSFCDWIKVESISTHSNRKFCKLLCQMIDELHGRGRDGTSNDARVLAHLLDEIRSHGWVVENSEHDAHELFQAIMNLLHSDAKLYPNTDLQSLTENDESQEELVPDLSVVHRTKLTGHVRSSYKSPILGYLASSMRCKSCLKKSSTKYDMFTSLSLTFPPTSNGTFRLEDLLKYYFLSDNLSDVDCENCTKSHGSIVKSEFIKEQSLGKIPHCLCLHIQRLGWYGFHEAVKRHDKVIFPALLDLGQLTLLNKMLRTSQYNRHPLAATLSADGSSSPEALGDVKQNSCWYSLVSLVEHQGSESSGHFITYRKIDHREGRWLYTSDLDVKEVTSEHVHSRTPYMLFYEKMSTTS